MEFQLLAPPRESEPFVYSRRHWRSSSSRSRQFPVPKLRRLAALTPIALTLWIGTASAGVVLSEQEVVTRPELKSITHQHTVSIDGNKEKIDEAGVHQILVDLDANKSFIIHPGSKDYFDLQFPLPGDPLGDVVLERVIPPTLDYKKTGKSRTLIGYKCDDYTASGDMEGLRYWVSACYSTEAPGAKDYSAFVRQAVAKLGHLPVARHTGSIPDGIPLEMRIETANYAPAATPAPNASAPAPSPAKAALAAKASKRPKKGAQAPKASPSVAASDMAVDEITVTKVEAKSIPADELAIPAGFKGKQPRILGF